MVPKNCAEDSELRAIAPASFWLDWMGEDCEIAEL
jgi:hypothetical protein